MYTYIHIYIYIYIYSYMCTKVWKTGKQTQDAQAGTCVPTPRLPNLPGGIRNQTKVGERRKQKQNWRIYTYTCYIMKKRGCIYMHVYIFTCIHQRNGRPVDRPRIRRPALACQLHASRICRLEIETKQRWGKRGTKHKIGGCIHIHII